MAGERRFTRIPPESTGDRIYLKHTVDIPYDNKAVDYAWEVGGFYHIMGGGGNSIMIHIHDVSEISDTEGVLHCHYDSVSTFANISAVNDQLINDSNNVTRAIINGDPIDLYVNSNHIVGYHNPEYGVDIDRFGSMNIRFGEGPAVIDSFGHLKVNNGRLLSNYNFAKSPHTGEFANSIEGEGSKQYDAEIGAHRLSIDKEGDRVTHTSNLFHPFSNNNSDLFVLAARCGDVGFPSDGTVRFWGAFDATDGYFFALVENNIQVRHRFTIDGNPTTEMIVNQSDWNQDTLDGTGGGRNPSGMLLDVSKINNYWIDFQFSGGGKTRWGVFYQGERIVCHQMYSNNEATHQPLSNPARPICWAIAKPAMLGPTAAGGKDFFAYGAAVYTDDTYDPMKHSQEVAYYNSSFELDHDSISTTYMYTLRPQLSLPWSDKENHTIYAPTSMDVYPHSTRHMTLHLQNATSDGTYWTFETQQDHYLVSNDKAEVFHTNNYNGRFVVFDTPTSTTFRVSNTTIQAAETHGQIKNMDTQYSEPHVEIRIFAKCIMRGVSFSAVNFTTTEVDTYGDHLAHGPEIARFLAEDRVLYSFDDLSDNIQWGAVYNTSDQSFARNSQSLELIQGDDDKYSTGVQRVRITIKDDSHPIYGTTIHYFDDKGKVIFRADDGSQNLTGFTTTHDLLTNDTGNDGTWYYLSLLDRDEAWLYNSEADIDDDRSVRVLQLNADPTGTIAVGDTVTLDTGGHTAVAKAIYVDGGNFYLGVEARSNAAFDGYTGTINTSAFTVSGVTKSSDRIGSWGGIGGGTWDESDERTTFDLDYKTSLLAVDSSGWGTSSDSISNENRLYGPTPIQPAWTFMVRHLHETTHDTNVRTVMRWKERIQ